MSSEDKPILFSNEKRIRFTAGTRIFYGSDSKIEDLHKNDKYDIQADETDSSKRGRPSLFSFLRVELTRGYILENDEERYSAKREKVYSFMKIPREVEKFMSYGFMQCADSFLFVYTFLPLRVFLALLSLGGRPLSKCFGLVLQSRNPQQKILTPAEVCDLLKATILVFCSVMMFHLDTNMLYHMIKSQSVIKLYIFYNMLEVGDRLFSAFGQDTIDALFWTATESRDRRREHLGVIPHLIFAIIYVYLHSFLVLLQATTLNVAMNSNNKALLTIMMSNNFVELKGSVFKKFDKNNLFQVSCSDVRERFHLVILLFIVVLQTMKEYSWKSDRFWVLLPDCVMVLIAEIFVDWVKHAFITRFNELQVDVYRDYTTSLAYDMAQTRQKHAFSDHSDLVARRMGFIPLPLGVVMIRVLAHSVHFGDIASVVVSLVAYLGLSSYRVLNNILILGFACLLIAQHKQEKASAHSPSSNNRSGSPLTVSRSSLGKESQKDSATSPLKPTVDVPITTCPVVNINGVGALEGISPNETDRINDLGAAVIFANSTVDLTYASLNEELLKVEGENIKIESAIEEMFSRSEPNIKCDFQKEKEKLQIEDILLKKRAESEPNLVNCKDDDDLPL